MAALAGIKSNILLSAGRVRQVAVGCRYFNMAKWLVHRKSGRPKQVAVHPRDRRWQVLLYGGILFVGPLKSLYVSPHPLQTGSFQHQLDFSGKHLATLQLRHEDYSLTVPPLIYTAD